MPWRWGHEAWSTRGAHFKLVQLILFFPFWRYWNNIFPVILHFFASTYPMLSVNCTCVFSGYDLNVKNLVNVNYSTNATCDSAMYVKQILTSRAICQLQIPADCYISILNRRSDQLGQQQKKMRFCIHKLIFRSEKTSRNIFISGKVGSFVGWSARKIKIVKSTIFINNDPIYHQSKVCSSSPYNDDI